MQPIIDIAAIEAHQVITAAEYRGQRNQPLESERQKLYDEDPPSTEFLNWCHLSKEQQRMTPPPI
jgi:predicted metallo-beta-lactamase superfamily hydrolase